MSGSDVASWVAAAATFAAALFAGLEFRRMRRQERDVEKAKINGVVVSWEPDVAPNHPEDDGWATWRYTFTAYNPSALPIRDVVVTVTFPSPARRVHQQGHGQARVDDGSTQLILRTPVLIGDRDRQWHRTVRMRYEDHDRLPETVTDISFIDMKGDPHVNRWSAVGGQPPSTT
ncbi:MAG: hypothetical protein HHJ14_02750 [Cellulomonas sp.]|nr:hypothetical protein [Cellulomonas sp.]